MKKAEKLLRLGRLDAAIVEYQRIVDEVPNDWKTLNALADLDLRANQPARASSLFERIAQHLTAEGFDARAQAFYKRILKVTPDNERAIEAIRLVAKHLAVGMTTLVNVFNPSTMLLGGTMRPVLACCLEDVAAAVAAQIVPGIAPPVIRLTTFGEAESAAGAAAIAHHEAFDVLMVDVEASVPSRRSA